MALAIGDLVWTYNHNLFSATHRIGHIALLITITVITVTAVKPCELSIELLCAPIPRASNLNRNKRSST